MNCDVPVLGLVETGRADMLITFTDVTCPHRLMRLTVYLKKRKPNR